MKPIAKSPLKSNNLLSSYINTLQTKPRLRTLAELSELMEVTQPCDFFSQITKHFQSSDFHRISCMNMTFEEVPRGSPVYKLGDPATSLYVILHGSVTLSIPDKILNSISIPREYQPIVKALNSSLQHKEPLQSADSEENTVKKLFNDQLDRDLKVAEGIVICKNRSITEVLGTGESFGLAGLFTDRLRSHDAIAHEKLYLGVINKSTFKTIISAYIEKKTNDKMEFLHNLPLFSTWSRISILKLLESFEATTYLRNQRIFKEGDDSNSVVFIMSGELRLTKSQITSKSVIDSGFSRQKSGNIPLRLGKVKKVAVVNEMQLVVKGKNQIIGIENISDSNSLRPYNCYCYSSRADLLILSRQVFLDKVSRPENSSFISSRKQSECMWLNGRLKEITEAEFKFTLDSDKGETRKQELKRKIRIETTPIVFRNRDPSEERVSTTVMAPRRKLSVHSRTKTLSLPATPKKSAMKRLPPPNFLLSFRKKRFSEVPEKFQNFTHSPCLHS